MLLNDPDETEELLMQETEETTTVAAPGVRGQLTQTRARAE